MSIKYCVLTLTSLISLSTLASSDINRSSNNINEAGRMQFVYGAFFSRYERYRDQLVLTASDDAILFSAAKSFEDELAADADAADSATAEFCRGLDLTKSATSLGSAMDQLFFERLNAARERFEILLERLSEDAKSSVTRIIEGISAETRSISTKTETENAEEDPALFKFRLIVQCAVVADGATREEARARAKTIYESGVLGRFKGELQ